MDAKSPFSISEGDMRLLEQNGAFRMVQVCLRNQRKNLWCSAHCSLQQTNRQTFVLHRDIIHALLLPLLQIHSRATIFATETLCRESPTRSSRCLASPRSMFDLELAFRSEARGAFSWLQCFFAEEQAWCATKGCPACVVFKVLHDEPFIRIVIASCRLSAHLKDTAVTKRHYPRSKDTISGATSTTTAMGSTASLPSFAFWLAAVRKAVSEDDFWGLHFWEEIEARACHLELCVKDLVKDCCCRALRASQWRATTTSDTLNLADRMPRTRTLSVRRVTLLPPLSLPYPDEKTAGNEDDRCWMRSIVEACRFALTEEAAKEVTEIGRSSTTTALGPIGGPDLVESAGLRARSITS